MRRGFDNLVLAMALLSSAPLMTSKRREPTAEQRAAADKRTERQKWNDAVEQRKADKQAAKHKATP